MTIVCLSALILFGFGLTIALAVHNYRLAQRARRAETIARLLREHFEGMRCRVEVRDSALGMEVLILWPEINDFVLGEKPEEVQVNGHSHHR